MLERPGHSLGRGGHQGAVEGAGHGQLGGAEAHGAGHFDGAVARGDGARHHNLPRGVEVGGHEHVALGGGGAQLVRLRLVGADQRNHAALGSLGGLLHEAAARGHQAQPVREGECAGDAERGVFAERQPVGGHGDDGGVLLDERRVARDAGGEERGLADVGAVELFLRSAEAELAEAARAEAGGLVRGAEDVGRRGAVLGPCLAHADNLRALAGAEEDEAVAHVDAPLVACGARPPGARIGECRVRCSTRRMPTSRRRRRRPG